MSNPPTLPPLSPYLFCSLEAPSDRALPTPTNFSSTSNGREVSFRTDGAETRDLLEKAFDLARWRLSAEPRFRTNADPVEVERQLASRNKFIARLDLPRFNPSTEKDMEDWLDEAAMT